MTTVTISGAGAATQANATDRIPVSQAGVKAYVTPDQILSLTPNLSYKRYIEEFLNINSSFIPYGWVFYNPSTSSSLSNNYFLEQYANSTSGEVCQLYLFNVFPIISSGKKLQFIWHGGIGRASDATPRKKAWFVGLADGLTGNNFINAGGTALAVDDCVGFAAYSTSPYITCVVRVGNVENSVTTAATYSDITAAAQGLTKLSFSYDGASVVFFKDDMQIASIVLADMSVMTISPMFAIRCTENKSNFLLHDYVFVELER